MNPRRRIDRICIGRQTDAKASGRHAVINTRRDVAVGAQLHGGDIVDANHGTVRQALENDVLEFLRRLEAAASRDRRIELLAAKLWQGTQLTGRDLYVLRLDGGDDVRCHQLVFDELVRIDPDAHGIARTEERGIANAWNTLQGIVEGAVDIVGKVGRHKLAIRRHKRRDEEEAAGRFRNGNTCILDDLRQLGGDELQLVLHLHLRDIGIGLVGEGQRNRGLTRRRRGRRHII